MLSGDSLHPRLNSSQDSTHSRRRIRKSALHLFGTMRSLKTTLGSEKPQISSHSARSQMLLAVRALTVGTQLFVVYLPDAADKRDGGGRGPERWRRGMQ